MKENTWCERDRDKFVVSLEGRLRGSWGLICVTLSMFNDNNFGIFFYKMKLKSWMSPVFTTICTNKHFRLFT